MNKRILLLGGTFDPVHCGHMVISLAAAEQLDIERIWLLPAAQPPHKTTAIASTEDRVAMLQLAIDAAEGFEICDVELRREGPSYTVDTLTEIHARLPDAELHWLIGADSIEELNSWYQIEALVKECTIVTAARPDYPTSNLSSTLTRLNPEQVKRIAKYLLDTPLVNISATDIRKRSRQGLSINELVPHAVQQYISQKNLYH